MVEKDQRFEDCSGANFWESKKIPEPSKKPLGGIILLGKTFLHW